MQFFQKEKSPKIREADHPNSSSEEASTNKTPLSYQGSSKNASKDGLDLYSILKKFRLDPKRLRYATYAIPFFSY